MTTLFLAENLGFLVGVFSYGWLAAVISRIRRSKKKGGFWLGLVAFVVIQIGLISLSGLLPPPTIILGDHAPANPWLRGYLTSAAFHLPSLISPLVFITAVILRIKYRDRFRRAPENPNEPSITQPPQAILEPVERKVEAASELVNIPEGVTIHIKRSRTLQHTISVNWNVSGEITGEASLAKLIDLTIKTTIERSKENSYQENETIEYEMDLNGNTSQGYKLVWTDVWRQGKVELETKTGKHSIPFEYRERSELDVIPVQHKA